MDNITLKKVQDRLFDIGVIVTDILEKNGINYMISFGTLLGAVRHHDFIPWDDDFDLWIFDEDYDKAIQVLKQELTKDVFLENEDSEPNFFHGWARIKDIYTITKKDQKIQDDAYQHNGLAVDLFRIKKMKYYELNEYIYCENINYLNRRKEKGLITIDDYFNKRKIAKTLLKQEKEFDSNEIVYGFITSYKNKCVLEQDIMPLNTVYFRGHKFMCPNNPDRVLRRLYGDYLILPPPNKRIQHYSEVEFIKR